MGAEDMNSNLELSYLFYVVNAELEYIEKSLIFLNQSLSNELEILEKEFNSNLNSLYLDGYESNFYDNYSNKYVPTEVILGDLHAETENKSIEHNIISTYIIQSILVKQISIIEKFFKNIYEYTRDERKNSTESNRSSIRIIAEKIKQYLYQNKKKHQVSDITTVVEKIKKNTDINIKALSSKYWTQLSLMKGLRNRFAHGQDEFSVNEKFLEKMNKQFGDDFIRVIQTENNQYTCELKNNFKPLIEFNANMQKYIDLISVKFN